MNYESNEKKIKTKCELCGGCFPSKSFVRIAIQADFFALNAYKKKIAVDVQTE